MLFDHGALNCIYYIKQKERYISGLKILRAVGYNAPCLRIAAVIIIAGGGGGVLTWGVVQCSKRGGGNN